MSWQIAAFTRNPLTGAYVYSLLCDTAADLPASITGTDYDGAITQGCTAKVISDGSTYTANSSGTWVLQPTSSMTINLPDVYSEAEVDALLAPMQDDIDATNAALPNLVDAGGKNTLILTDTSNQTSATVTCTYNGDGTYTISGTSTAAGYFYLARTSSNPVFASGSVITGCTGGGSNTYKLAIAGTTLYQYEDPLYLTSDVSGSLIFSFASGLTFNDLILRPMVCTKANYDISTEFVPYCPTLYELYQMILSGNRSLPVQSIRSENTEESSEIEPETEEIIDDIGGDRR